MEEALPDAEGDCSLALPGVLGGRTQCQPGLFSLMHTPPHTCRHATTHMHCVASYRLQCWSELWTRVHVASIRDFSLEVHSLKVGISRAQEARVKWCVWSVELFSRPGFPAPGPQGLPALEKEGVGVGHRPEPALLPLPRVAASQSLISFTWEMQG